MLFLKETHTTAVSVSTLELDYQDFLSESIETSIELADFIEATIIQEVMLQEGAMGDTVRKFVKYIRNAILHVKVFIAKIYVHIRTFLNNVRAKISGKENEIITKEQKQGILHNLEAARDLINEYSEFSRSATIRLGISDIFRFFIIANSEFKDLENSRTKKDAVDIGERFVKGYSKHKEALDASSKKLEDATRDLERASGDYEGKGEAMDELREAMALINKSTSAASKLSSAMTSSINTLVK